MYAISGKRVFVAGHTGFLGGWITGELLAQGAEVTGVSLSGSPGYAGALNHHQADLRRYEEAQDLLADQDALVIAAAVTSGAKVMADTPLVHLLDNILINSSLLRAAVENRVERVVFISSSTIYPNTPEAMKESDWDGSYFDRYEVVATMKRASEDFGRLVSRFSNSGVIVVRPGNAYGPYDHFDSETSHVIPALIAKVAGVADELEVWGDGKDLKNFIYVQDLAKGVVRALQFGSPGSTYNLGGPSENSIAQIVEILLAVAGKSGCPVFYDASKPSMIPVRRLDSSLAARELGFNPETSLIEGLGITYRWYIDKKNNDRR